MRRGARPELIPSPEACKRLRAGDLSIAVQKFAPIELLDLAGDAAATVVRDAGAALQDVAFIISDESKDRYGDTIAADGWDFEAYAANPVLLWAHDYSAPPVGRMSKPWKTVGKKVKAVVEAFTPGDLNPMGPAVEGMIRKGFLNASSVGFSPLEFTFNEDYSMNYVRQELLEVSVVPVPANANALVAAKSAGLWVPAMQEWVVKQLDLKTGGLPGAIALQAFSALRAPTSQVPATYTTSGAAEADAGDEPVAEVLELNASMLDNTAAIRELVAELRADRAERRSLRAKKKAARIAARVAAQLHSPLKKF